MRPPAAVKVGAMAAARVATHDGSHNGSQGGCPKPKKAQAGGLNISVLEESETHVGVIGSGKS
ncbi:hypothetical protein GCM10007338_01450 [Corynebacterium pelargi]|nr:hypothetical protein GCM10007338_01450 [Corynebacterium pelargi]